MCVERLESGDILFIDSSHVCKIGSDVPYLLFDVVPRVKPGVIVHIHDIFLPREYQRRWIMSRRSFWNEQYLVHAFLCFNSAFEVHVANAFLRQHHPDRLRRLSPDDPEFDNALPSSLWLRRIG